MDGVDAKTAGRVTGLSSRQFDHWERTPFIKQTFAA